MGKKLQGARLRAKQRSRKAVEDLQEQQAEAAAGAIVEAKPDEQLFVLDTVGDRHLSTSLTEGLPLQSSKKKRKPTGLSDKEKKQVAKLLEKHDRDQLANIAAKGKERMAETTKPRSRKRLKADTKASFDLWDTKEELKGRKADVRPGIGASLAGVAPDHSTVKAQRAPERKTAKVAVDVAKSGQSYHPDRQAHDHVIQEAVEIESKREQALQTKKEPLAKGLSQETKALIVGDSDSDSSDDESLADGPVGSLPKRTDKLTRAQRNKQKRLRAEKLQTELRRKERKRLNQVGEIPRFNKEIKKQQRENMEKKQRLEEIKGKVPPLGKDIEKKAAAEDPIRAPTVPVALPSELKSSLRSLKPKGSLAAERLASFVDRELAPKRANIEDRKRLPKKRKLSVKGKRNNEAVGKDFVVLG